MKNREEAQTYAWNWFALHAGQRLQLVNFWLVAVAFLASAYVQARASHLVAIQVGLAVTGAAASLGFMRLDRRTRQLVQVSEDALRYLETTMVEAGMNDVTELVRRAGEVSQARLDSYRIIIQGMQLLVAFLFLAAAIYSLY